MKCYLVKEKEKGGKAIYSFKFEESEESEFNKFMLEFMDTPEYQNSLYHIITTLNKMLDDGFLERHFRYEEGYKIRYRDSIVVALPVFKCSLRLYCLRISDNILIVGNGGIKTSQRYQDSESLSKYVEDLKSIKNFIQSRLRNKTLKIIKPCTIQGDNTFFFNKKN